MATITCPKCGAVNPADAMNCQKCRVNLAFALANASQSGASSADTGETVAAMGPPRKNNLHQQWEYCELEVSIGGPLTGVQGHLTIFRADGNFLERNDKYGVLFAQLGQEGWDMVAASARIEAGLGGKHKINYVFKRSLL